MVEASHEHSGDVPLLEAEPAPSSASAIGDNPLVPRPPSDSDVYQLTELTRSLVAALQALDERNARSATIQNAIEDLRAASRAVAASAPPAAESTGATGGSSERGCGDRPCDCVASSCCCFNIVMSYVRVLSMQLEPVDSNLNPWGHLEVKMFAYLDGGIGAMIPNMFSALSLDKLVQHAGLKVAIERRIGTVCLPKGSTKMIRIGVDAVEEERGLVEQSAGRDEEGSSSGVMVLECCCSVPPTVSFDLEFTSGGQGGGAIEVGFRADKTC